MSRQTRQRLILLPLLFGLLLAGAVRAQGTIETTLTAEPAEVTVGDPVQLTLSVTHPTGYFVIVPTLDEVWGDFTVVGQSPATTTDNGDGTTTTAVVYDTRLFTPGVFVTPPLPYTVTDGAGNLFEFTAQPVNVNVASVLVEGDAELRDIKPQAEIPSALWAYLLGGGLALALLAGGLLLVARRRRPVPVVVDTRTPYQRALDDLRDIEAMQLPAEGRYNEHYTLVSESIRRYMGDTFHIPVLERTTAEIQADLRSAAVDPGVRELFVSFLQESDLVKFANFTPTPGDAAQLLAQARLILEATRPVISGEGSNGRSDESTAGLPSGPAPAFSTNGEGETEEVSA